MVKSLRWRLQLWHAIVLALVLLAFGVYVDMLQWQTQRQRVDNELTRIGSTVMARLPRLFPPPNQRRFGPGNRQRGGGDGSRNEPDLAAVVASIDSERADALRVDNVWGDDRERRQGSRENRPPLDGPRLEGRRPENGGPPSGRGPRDMTVGPPETASDRPPPSIGLPEELLNPPDHPNDTPVYFVVWNAFGQVLEKSASAPEVPFPNLQTVPDDSPIREIRDREQYREALFVTPFWRTHVLVGRSREGDVKARWNFAAFLAIAGAIVLTVGILGGGWVTARAIQPLTAMSEAAATISAKNLGARVQTEGVDTEVSQLGTVLNQTFSRLQSAFEQQQQFTADASHELRTPVSVVLTQTQLALSRQRSPEEYRDALTACRNASLRMKTLIERLLTLARLDAVELPLSRSKFDLADVARDCAEMVRPLAAERGVTIKHSVQSLPVDGDRDRLAQLITNLLSNAIRYNREGGHVCLTIGCDQQVAQITVSDNGIGIPADSLPFVFDRFFRVDKVRSSQDGGSGLGLSICKTIVEAHDGTITATSEMNVGTTFTVRLPLPAAPAPDPSEQNPSASLVPQTAS